MQRALGLIAVLLVTGGVYGCVTQAPDPRAEDVRGRFRAVCPPPAWWDDVSVDVQIRTYNELLAYWHSEERTDDQFFKAAYQAILDNPLDDHIVVTAIKLIPGVAGGYPHVREMLEFALDRYFDYDRPMGNYLGKPGDSIGGIVKSLVVIYNRTGEADRSLALINRLLEERAPEINDQILELLAIEHARAWYERGDAGRAIEVLDEAIATYAGDWEARLREERARYVAMQTTGTG